MINDDLVSRIKTLGAVPGFGRLGLQFGAFHPRMAIQGMATCTGRGVNQRIGADEALRVNTINGACNSHEAAIKGSISPGKLAAPPYTSLEGGVIQQARPDESGRGRHECAAR